MLPERATLPGSVRPALRSPPRLSRPLFEEPIRRSAVDLATGAKPRSGHILQLLGSMKKPKNSGNPAHTVCFRPSQSLSRAITAWMARRNDVSSLTEAIGRLVELGLASDTDHDRQTRRARKLAGDTIDRVGDATTTADTRASRKRDLLDGPEEFGRVRIDRPKRSRLVRDGANQSGSFQHRRTSNHD